MLTRRQAPVVLGLATREPTFCPESGHCLSLRCTLGYPRHVEHTHTGSRCHAPNLYPKHTTDSNPPSSRPPDCKSFRRRGTVVHQLCINGTDLPVAPLFTSLVDGEKEKEREKTREHT